MSDTADQIEVTWTKIVLTGVPGMECIVTTTRDGRTLDHEGEPIPLDKRPRVCGRPGAWAVGRAFVCKEHAAEVAELMGDNIEDIDRDWRAQL